MLAKGVLTHAPLSCGCLHFMTIKSRVKYNCLGGIGQNTVHPCDSGEDQSIFNDQMKLKCKNLEKDEQTFSTDRWSLSLISVFLFIQDDSDDSEPDLGGVVLGLLTFSSENDASIYNTLRVSVVIEGAIVMSVLRHADALLVLFGLIYALHLSYPKALNNTFEFVQKVLLGLDGGKLSPKLQTMKNKLTRMGGVRGVRGEGVIV